MPDTEQAYVNTLATQLRTRRPDLLELAEDELHELREFKAAVARVINNPAIAYDIRLHLAHDLGLPEPAAPEEGTPA